MKRDSDVFGRMLLAHQQGRDSGHVIERSDGHVDPFWGQPYFDLDRNPGERRCIRLARGRVLDIGCGAGRHALALQLRGRRVTAIDASPLAIQVCRMRGVRDARVLSIERIGRLPAGAYETVVMFGNNLGLFGSVSGARRLLKVLARITTPAATLYAGTLNVHGTTNPEHLAYHRWNRRQGRLPGQLRLRVRFGGRVGPWFEYLMASPEEIREILRGTAWTLDRVMPNGVPCYIAVIRKA